MSGFFVMVNKQKWDSNPRGREPIENIKVMMFSLRTVKFC